MDDFCKNNNNNDSQSPFDYINPKRYFCDYMKKYAENRKRLAEIKELQGEILDSNEITKEKADKYRENLTEQRKQQYEDCKRDCTDYVRRRGLETPLCSNTGETYESYCHIDCDKEYITPLIDEKYIGRCDDPRKYPKRAETSQLQRIFNGAFRF